MAAPQLALIGAFPFPLPQGSQVYFEDQARALSRAGAACTLFTYGRGRGAAPADLRIETPAAGSAPKHMRSGPSFAKPFADAALLRTFLSACRRERFDAVLAHNAEAAAIALTARRWTGIPVVYVVHTLLDVELSAYLPAWAEASANAIGGRIDRGLARGADGLIVLADSAEQALAGVARGEIARIPPALSAAEAPGQKEIDCACARFDLDPDHYVLYSGNLDGYQELELLDAAARHRPASAPPIVVATHTEPTAAERAALAALSLVHIDGFDRMRALAFGARALVLARRRVGGFPIKLLNYMETRRPIVAYASVAEGLTHGTSAWLLGDEAGPTAIAGALDALDADADLRARLGQGARARLASHHDPSKLATRTLTFAEKTIAAGRP